jgi:RNA polymerase sigma-70 factor, ECF subfamily
LDRPDDEVQVMETPADAGPAAAPTFEAAVRAHEDRVRRLARRLVGWPDDVEDVVQDVFLIVLRKRDGFRGDAAFATWLTAVTVNACRSWRRGLRSRLALIGRLWTRRMETHAPPDDPLVRGETSERVRRALRRLNKPDREVIVLRHLEELSIAEIAESLGLKPNAVEVRLHRARRRLKTLLEEDGHE